MISRVRKKVKRLLDSHKKYRDSDNVLMAKIWYDDAIKMGLRTTYEFLQALKRGELTSWESICRARRKLQELHPYLEGRNRRIKRLKANELKIDLKKFEEDEIRDFEKNVINSDSE